jgi:predicted hydrocarbon binding protein
MASKAMETEGRDESFWREFPVMTGYFAPGIVPLLEYLDLDSKRVMHEFGEEVGRKAAAKTASLSLDQMLDEFARVWQTCKIGTLAVESRNPIVIQISNCTVCGQLDGTGDTFECAFHEGFFQGALSERLGKPVKVSQETSYAGDAGTWCRRLAVDVP